MKICILLLSLLVANPVPYKLFAADTKAYLQKTEEKFNPDSDTSSQLQLLDFLALYKKNNVILNWTFQNDSVGNRYVIERSTDGIHFLKTGEIESASSIGINTLYAHVDNVKSINTLKKDLYYRIKKVDKNESAKYSKLLLVRVFETKILKIVSITPNPVVNNIKVNVELKSDAMVGMKVMNNEGAELMHTTEKGIAGKNTFELIGSNALPRGIYIFEVIVNSNERMTMQLIKD